MENKVNEFLKSAYVALIECKEERVKELELNFLNTFNEDSWNKAVALNNEINVIKAKLVVLC